MAAVRWRGAATEAPSRWPVTYRILGPLQALVDDRPVDLGGPRQRLVLAVLLLHRGERVGIEPLIDAVWERDPPTTARRTVQAYVSRLRGVLGDDRLMSVPRGYALAAGPDDVDADRFARLAATGRAQLDTDPEAAATTLRAALALWRGPAWGEVADEPALRPDATRLEGLRSEAVEDRIEADLRRGAATSVVPELEGMVAADPLRERPWRQLLRALAADGRGAEALVAYERARETFAEALGADPSPALREVHQRILRGEPDPSLVSAGAGPGDVTTGLDVRVRFTTSRDGTRLAWTRSGSGPALVRTGMYISHVEEEARNPVWGRWLRDLAARFTYVRYDERGLGLSGGDARDLEERAFLDDLDAVIEATGEPRVALFGMSQGAAVAVAYAAERPERVSHLVLLGGYAAGASAPGRPGVGAERTRAFAEMVRLFWEDPHPTFREGWTNRLIPDGTAEDRAAVDAMQVLSSSGEVAARVALARDVLDARDRARQVRAPTLVAHARDDHIIDHDNGVELATLIPDATLLTLESRNHLLLDEPAWGRFLAAVTDLVTTTGSG